MMIKQTKTVPYAAASDTGTALNPSALPTRVGRDFLAVASVDIRVVGTFNKTAPGTVNMNALFSQIYTKISDLGLTLCDLGGVRLHRLHRARQNGVFFPSLNGAPDWAGFAAAAGAGQAFDVTFKVDWRKRVGRKFFQQAVPCPLVKASEFRLTMPALTALAADVVALAANIAVTWNMVPRKKMIIPALDVFASHNLVAGTEPEFPVLPGRVTTGILAPAADGVFPNATDFAALGYRLGERQISDNDSPGQIVYDEFNDNADSAMEVHFAGSADRTASFPLFAPYEGVEGVSLASGSIPRGMKPWIRGTPLAAAYAFISSYRLDRRDSWYGKACEICGVRPGSGRVVTADNKPLPPGSESLAYYMPEVF